MSHVTDVILTCALSERGKDRSVPAIDEINRWLEDQAEGDSLTPLNGLEGGRKVWQACIFGAGLNHLDSQEFADIVWNAPWKNVERVQLFIRDEDDEVFTLLSHGLTV